MSIRTLMVGLMHQLSVTLHSPVNRGTLTFTRYAIYTCRRSLCHTPTVPTRHTLHSMPGWPISSRVSRALHNGHLIKTSLLPLRTAAVMTAQVRCYAQEPAEVKPKVKVRGIQKDVSPLSTRRILRRKKTSDAAAADKIVYDGVAYATAEEINLESLKTELQKQGLYILCALPTDATDALHVEAKYRVDDERREIFFFREGSVIFWNMPEEEKRTVLQFLRRHQRDSYDYMLIEENFEQVDFTFIDTPSRLAGDEFQLQRQSESPEETARLQLEKYTFSNALGLSVKLSIWEASLERYVDSIEWLLLDLKEGKKLKMSREDVLRKTGELFTLRHLINVSSDLLDTPDFYWDRASLDDLYTKTCSHLNITRRTKVMNEKLTYCCELVELVREHLNDKHHTRLEWMIIILIMIEVGFEILHLIERYSS